MVPTLTVNGRRLPKTILTIPDLVALAALRDPHRTKYHFCALSPKWVLITYLDPLGACSWVLLVSQDYSRALQ